MLHIRQAVCCMMLHVWYGISTDITGQFVCQMLVNIHSRPVFMLIIID